MKAKGFGRTRHGAAACATLLVALTAGASHAGAGDDCPPNPEPGKCYEKVYRPALYENYVDQALDPRRPAQPADRVVTSQRRIREASFAWRVVSCDGGFPPGTTTRPPRP